MLNFINTLVLSPLFESGDLLSSLIEALNKFFCLNIDLKSLNIILNTTNFEENKKKEKNKISKLGRKIMTSGPRQESSLKKSVMVNK